MNRTTDYIKERDKVLLLVDRLVVIELGDNWTLDAHMKRKAAILQILDHEGDDK